MEFSIEDTINNLGCGFWQAFQVLAVFFIQGCYTTQFIAAIFTNMPVDFRCSWPMKNESTINYTFDNECYEDESLVAYNLTILSINKSDFVNNGEVCTFDYEPKLFRSTFTTEYNLVCENSHISVLYQTLAFLGVIVGSLFNGLSDRFGRVTMIRIGTIILMIGVLNVGLVQNMYVVLISRFIIGLCYDIVNGSAYTLLIEILPSDKRSSAVAVISNLANVVFSVLTGMVSYFVRDWRTLHLILSVTVYFLIITVIFIDESPRWLIHKGRLEESKIVLDRAARLNRVQKPSTESLVVMNEKFSLNHQGGSRIGSNSFFNIRPFLRLVSSIFKSPILCSFFLLSLAIWFFTSMIYYAIPLNANNFTSNPYVYIMMLGVADIFPTIFGPLIIKKYGNINAGSATFLITMICLLSIITIPESLWWIKWSLLLVAIMMISVNYVICYILSSELFPTEVRSITFGMGSFAKHTGVLLASYITTVASSTLWWLPNIVSGFSCGIVIILIRFLPETGGQPLCDTIIEVEERYRTKKSNHEKDILK